MNRFGRLVSAAGLFALGAAAPAVWADPAAENAAVATAPASGDVAEWVSRKVESVQPTERERKFDRVGWLTDVREAKRLAREHDRPVFLFTHDGRMALGRC